MQSQILLGKRVAGRIHALVDRRLLLILENPAQTGLGQNPHQTTLIVDDHQLPHAMIMKIQCGGLGGLRDVLDPAAPAPDVHRLVRRAQAEYGALDALPFSRIIQGVSHWQGRRRPAPKDPG